VTKSEAIKIYTDGSCHTQQLIGSWAALIFYGEKKQIIKNVVKNTTHNRMELEAIIKAVEFIEKQNLTFDKIEVYSDSQYAVKLRDREARLKEKNFITKAGKQIQNYDLVIRFLELFKQHKIEIVKVKAHQKDGDIYNREVDLIVRELLRDNLS
jgi:ribonuclease HI